MFDISLLHIVNVILLCLLIISVLIVMVRNIVTSIMLLSMFGVSVSLLYLGLSAPDVAMTVLLFIVAIGGIMLMVAVNIIGSEEKKRPFRFLPLVIVLLVGGVLILTMMGMPIFGNQDTPISSYLAPYYFDDTSETLWIKNVVASILLRYRAFDSLGLIFVIFTAGISVSLLISQTQESKRSVVKKHD